MALSLVGGVLGLLLGFGLAFMGRWLFGLDATVPPHSLRVRILSAAFPLPPVMMAPA